MLVNCFNCNKEINIKPSQVKKSKNNFCSKECHNESRHKIIYKEMSDRVGQDFKTWLRTMYIDELKPASEISILLYGADKNNKTSVLRWLKKFEINARTGSESVKLQWVDNEERREQTRNQIYRTMRTPKSIAKANKTRKTAEYRKKASERKTGDKNPMYGVLGENHHNWDIERTHEIRVAERKTFKDSRWRKGVFQRDNYICQVCGFDKGGILVAHHLNSYDIHKEDRYKTDNGITICEPCHKDYHSKYGYGKNTKEQYKEWEKIYGIK